MNARPSTLRTIAAGILGLALAAFHPGPASALDGVWAVNDGGSWGDSTKWAGGIIANGADHTADFSQVNITGNRTVTLDMARALGHLVFGDADVVSHNWILTGTHTLTLDVSSGTPTINVIHNAREATIESNTVLAGSDGLTKLGDGRLTIKSTSTYTGPTRILGGEVYLWTGAGLATTDSVLVDGGRILLQNAGNRINDTAPITLRGGMNPANNFTDRSTLYAEGSSVNEVMGTLNLGAGRSVVSFSGGSTSTLTFSNLGSVGTGSVLRVRTDAGNVIFTTAPDTTHSILGGWATSLLNDTTGGNFLTVDGTGKAIEHNPAANNDHTTWGSADNVRVSSNVVGVTTKAVNSLNINGGNSVAIAAGNTLTLGSGGLIVRTSGTAVSGGTLASTGDMYIHSGRTAGFTLVSSALDVGGGTGNLVVSGNNTGGTGVFGWLTLNHASNAFGNLYINSQTLRLQSSVGAFSDAGTKTVYLNAGNIANEIDGASYNRKFEVGTAGGGFSAEVTNIATTWNGDVLLNGLFTIDGRGKTGTAHTLNGKISGAGGFTVFNANVASAPTITLAGNNTYQGVTTLTNTRTIITHGNALGSTLGGTVVNSGASLQLQGGIAVGAEALRLAGSGPAAGDGALRNLSGDNSWAGAVTLTGDAQIAVAAGSLTLSGGIGETGGARALTKSGSGLLHLTGPSAYTGSTLINEGALRLSGSGSLGSGPTVVAFGATLEGAGAIGGDLDVTGTLAPGSSPGILTVGGNLTFLAGSFFEVDILGNVPGTGYDQVQLLGGGNLDLGFGTSFLDFSNFTYAGSLGDIVFLITLDGGTSSGYFQDLALNPLFDGTSLGTINGIEWFIGYGGNSAGGDYASRIAGGQDVIFFTDLPPVVVIPEPGSAALLGLFGLAMIRRRMRRVHRNRGY